LIKSVRGRTSNEERKVSTDYWREYDVFNELDVDLALKANDTREMMKEMDVVCNGRLSFLTKHALRMQKERFDELMAEDQHRELFSTITDQVVPIEENEAARGEQAA